VGAVVGDKDRYVADDRDADLICSGAQKMPLLEEQELAKDVEIYFAFELLPGLRECLGVAVPQGRRPIDPVALGFAERGEDREIVQPCLLGAAEGIDALVQRGWLAVEGLLEDTALER